MKRFLIHPYRFLIPLLLFISSVSVKAQTVALNDGITIQPNTNRVGMNIGSITFYDNGQILKNLIGSFNPGFEPLINRQVWNIKLAGTANSFTVNNIYDGAPANYWTGATFVVYAGTPGAPEDGCTGLVASNTGPNYPTNTSVAPVITFATACPAALAPNDIITLTKKTFPTPETWWENPAGGEGGGGTGVKNGGREYSDTTDLCATCGTQALTMDASASSSAQALLYYFYDGAYNTDVFVLMNGTYQLSFWAKAASGTPKLETSELRFSSNGFNCGSQTFMPTTTWAQYTFTCTANENATTLVPNTAQIEFAVTGGVMYLDNVNWQKVTSVNNPTVFRDEVIETLQNYFATSTPGPRGIFRDWTNQNGETVDNWIEPSYAHSPTGTGGGYFVGPVGSGATGLQLEDYLVICQTIGADPYFVFPVTASNQEAENLIEFLAGSSSTTYGAKRAALGQVEPWTTVFGKIHIELGNEDWNNFSFDGQAIYNNNVQPFGEGDYDYTVRAGEVFSSMRSAPDYEHASFDLIENAQTGVISSPQSVKRAQPDSLEIEDYTQAYVDTFDNDVDMWGPAFVEPWLKTTSPLDPKNFYNSVTTYQALNVCGYDGKQPCGVNVYEWGQGSLGSSAAEENAGTGIGQATLDIVNAGSGEGIVMALQPLLNMQKFGIEAQSFFALDQLQGATQGNAVGGTCSSTGTGCSYQQILTKLWGGTIDMGGATNNIRPTMLGVQLVNQSIIGPMFSCPINNNLTYNNTPSPNGNGTAVNGFRTPALTGVPYLYSFCFENGKSRSIVLVNTDINNSHTINFSGNNGPTGTVVVRQYAPSGLDLLNEEPNGTNDQGAPMLTNLTSKTVSNPTSITLPAHSVTALDYTAASAPFASAPAFSPGPATYTVPTPITLSSTAGATIYYTTDGSTPTTSSNVYTEPITISSNETLTAMATDPGYNNSTVSSASYVIAPVLPTPSFSVAAGTYTTPQQVSISDTASGVSYYYTTNGSAPTTSSTHYAGPIAVAANETVQAIAVAAGFTNSEPATAMYIIAPVLPSPTFSLAAGSYGSSQTVSIADSAPGVAIFYTTNGATPTMSSPQFTTPITVSATETLEAIAVEGGFTSSPVAAANYSIAGSTQYISYLSGTITPANLTLNGGATVTSGGLLQVTDGDSAEARAAWFKTPVPVQSFVTDFTFQQLNPNANGMTFTIQNAGTTAVGGGGSGLGYQGIGKSLAVKFDFYNSNGQGTDSTGLFTDGVYPTVPAVDMTSSGVKLSSSDIMDAHFVYDGTNLTLTLTDTVTNASVTEVFPVNIPSVVGGNTAYVGFTGGTGGKTATQNVLSWMYVSAAGSSTASTIASPTFSPAAGTYASSQSVSIGDTTSGSTIYYTTNGTTPTTSSSVYSAPITVGASETLEAIAVSTGHTNSPVASAAYVINAPLPAPAFSVAAGAYTGPQTVGISEATAGTTIYYTTNGSTPTTASTVYAGPITIGLTETLQAIAVETGYTNSPVASAAYTITTVLPAPVFSVATGTYTASQSVSISDATAGTTIYYTTNGTAPTTASSVYSAAITVGATETLEAIAVKAGSTNSSVTSAAYTIALVLPAPTFSVATGTYTSAQAVVLSDATAGTTIYYTTNGTAPTTSSAIYTGAITVGISETIEAMAVKSGNTNSPVASAAYILNTSDPTYISVASGGFVASALSLNGGASVTNGLLQLTDGGTDEARTAWFSKQVPVQNFVTDFTFEQLDATADGMTFTIQGQGPTAFGGNGGNLGYQGITKSIAIKFDLYSNAGEGTDSTGLYTDGATPTVPAINLSSTAINLHSGDIMDAHMVYNGTDLTMILTDTVTKASVTEVFTVNIPSLVGSTTAYVGFTGGTGGHSSTQNVLTWTYSSSTGTTTGAAAAAPVLSLKTGTYEAAQALTITDMTKGATIYYTTNGTTPTNLSTKYSAPITIATTEKVEAVAVSADLPNSPVAVASYTIIAAVPTPTFSKAGGIYPASEAVTISDSLAGATIYYTVNGATPTASSTKYTGAITVSKSETVKAIAIKAEDVSSAVASETYTISAQSPAPAFSKATGTYTGAQVVTLSDSLADATIYYTTNGATPTTASTKYTSPITVSATEKLSAIAVATGFTESTVATASLTIALVSPTFSKAAGTYTTAQTVTLTDATAGATIYYTVNGTTPTTASTKYTAPITVSKTEKVEAIAVLAGHANSSVATAAYTISAALAEPAFSKAAGTYTTAQSVTLTDATAGTTIYYTVNGTTPTTASTKYTAAITVSKTEKVEAIAVLAGHTNSGVASISYTIN